MRGYMTCPIVPLRYRVFDISFPEYATIAAATTFSRSTGEWGLVPVVERQWRSNRVAKLLPGRPYARKHRLS